MTVLCYHAVESQWTSALAVDPSDFEAQCQWLSRRRNVLTLDQALTRMGADGRLPRGQVHLSFDDGFESLYDSMFPAVTRYGLPSSVFLVAQTLTPRGQVVDWVDDPPECPPSTLNLDQVLEMQDAGVDFQSHTWAHRDLTSLDYDECVEDLRSSRQLLSDLLGKRVTSLAYPRGRHSAMVREAARKAGYTHAFALPEENEVVDEFAIPRVGIYRGNSARVFQVKNASSYLALRHGRLASLGRRVRGH
ncbi:MAG: polysaccharide deacetylase family protein [Actinomycetes bacterium]